MIGLATGLILLLAAAVSSAALIIWLKPLLFRYALARPNGRSSHKEPVPQGAGIAVVLTTLAGTLLTSWLMQSLPPEVTPKLLPFCLAILALAVIGLVDDIRPLQPAIRLIGQIGAATGLYFALPDAARALPFLPFVVEAAICIVGLVWFVNLTNFMDGIDGMIVAGVLPMLAGIVLLALGDHEVGSTQTVLALALAGALIGFAPFNRPVAQVFLGDVGSLAIGGITGWLLLSLACSGRLASALILALYFLADTGWTLYRRWQRGEHLSQAHREHAYQQATADGWSVPAVTSRVWRVGLGLALIALMAGTTQSVLLQLAGLAVAVLLVADMLIDFGQTASPDQTSPSLGGI